MFLQLQLAWLVCGKCEVFFFFFSDMVFESIAHYSSMLESLLPFPSHVEHLLFFCFLLLNPFKVLRWVLETGEDRVHPGQFVNPSGGYTENVVSHAHIHSSGQFKTIQLT